jgi:hypothetical protein
MYSRLHRLSYVCMRSDSCIATSLLERMRYLSDPKVVRRYWNSRSFDGLNISHIDLSFYLSNRQAEQATPPVMIHLTVTVSVNAISSRLPARVNRSPTERAAQPPMAHTPKTAAFTEHLPTRMDRLPVETNPSQTVSADARDTTRKSEESMEAHHSGPPLIPESERTIDDIIQTVKRSVHQSEAESFLLA